LEGCSVEVRLQPTPLDKSATDGLNLRLALRKGFGAGVNRVLAENQAMTMWDSRAKDEFGVIRCNELNRCGAGLEDGDFTVRDRMRRRNLALANCDPQHGMISGRLVPPGLTRR